MWNKVKVIIRHLHRIICVDAGILELLKWHSGGVNSLTRIGYIFPRLFFTFLATS